MAVALSSEPLTPEEQLEDIIQQLSDAGVPERLLSAVPKIWRLYAGYGDDYPYKRMLLTMREAVVRLRRMSWSTVDTSSSTDRVSGRQVMANLGDILSDCDKAIAQADLYLDLPKGTFSSVTPATTMPAGVSPHGLSEAWVEVEMLIKTGTSPW